MRNCVRSGTQNTAAKLQGFSRGTGERGNMTIAELYEWAAKEGVENFELLIQYSDSGGYYTGTREPEIDIETMAGKVIL